MAIMDLNLNTTKFRYLPQIAKSKAERFTILHIQVTFSLV